MENVKMNIPSKSRVRKIVLLNGDFLQNRKCVFIFPIKSFLYKQSYFQQVRQANKDASPFLCCFIVVVKVIMVVVVNVAAVVWMHKNPN